MKTDGGRVIAPRLVTLLGRDRQFTERERQLFPNTIARYEQDSSR